MRCSLNELKSQPAKQWWWCIDGDLVENTETTWLGQKACLWRAPWPVRVGSHVRRDQQSHPPLGANFLVTFSLVTLKILITWRLTTFSLWAMACWTIRFCRDLWASGFLSHDMMSQVTCHMSSALLYFLPEDPKYVLKKNSLLWKVRILINGSFYCVQVSHDWLTKSLKGQKSSLVCLKKSNCNWLEPCLQSIHFVLNDPTELQVGVPQKHVFENACSREKALDESAGQFRKILSDQKRWKSVLSEKGGGQIELVTARE